jgi:hypothetical protein
MRIQWKTVLIIITPVLIIITPVLIIITPVLIIFAAAYIQWALAGLPALPAASLAVPPPGGRTSRVSCLAPHHSLRQFPFHHPADPQRIADSRGSSPAVRERALHSRNRVAPADPGGGAERPRMDGEAGLPVSLSLDRSVRRPAYDRHGAALTFPQYSVLGV